MNLKFVFFVVFIFPSTNIFSQDLDDATQVAIKTACHSNLLNKDDGPLSSFIFKNSPVCEEVIQQGEDVDIWPILKRYNVNTTQEDLNRMYGENGPYYRNPSKIELECTVKNPLKEQGIDGECMRRRQRLEANGAPMTQQQYEQISAYCEGEPTQSGCIEQWINEEWVRKGVRQLPSRKVDVGGLNIDELMGGGQTTTSSSENVTQPAEVSLSIDDLMGNGASQGPQNIESEFAGLGTTDQDTSIKAGEIGFDNIYAGREQIELDKQKQKLATLNSQIAGQCQCALGKTQCYAAARFQYDQLTSAAQQQASDFSQSKTSVCNNWASNLRGRSSDQIQTLNGYIKNGEIIASNLDRLDAGFGIMISQLQQQEQKIKTEVARREAEQRRIAEEQAAEARYNAIGTAIAIGAAGVAAANLPSQQGMELFTNITRDVLSENGTALNTVSMMQTYGYGSIMLEEPDFSSMTNNTMDEIYAYQEQNNQVTTQTTALPNFENISQTPGSQSSPQATSTGGAFAMNYMPTNRNVGLSFGPGAETSALAACGQGCGISERFNTACASAAFGTASGSPAKIVGWGTGDNEQQAVNRSLDACEVNGGNSCTVVSSGCN